MRLQIVDHLGHPRARHHYAQRTRGAFFEHLLDSGVRVVGHSRIVHVQDDDTVVLLPAEFFSVSGGVLAERERGEKEQSGGAH
jgi:hypothetical protein